MVFCTTKTSRDAAFVRAFALGFPFWNSVPAVNVNATHTTTGATALLLPAQNTHTLHVRAVGWFLTPRVFSTEQALFRRIFPQRLQPSELRLRRVLPR
jgi:hypothetical protein